MAGSLSINTGKEYIVVTGAAGFIGSFLSGYLNKHGYHDLILVDDFSRADKAPNLEGKQFEQKVEREQFFEWLHLHKPAIRCVFHMGARTDTTEFNYAIHAHLNLEYSKKVWHYCTVHRIPLVYASSAATYGAGEQGYDDREDLIRICYWLMEKQPASAIYNLGTGKARSFEDLVKATYAGLDLPAKINYIDMPEDIRDKYQYFTEANMQKLRAAGYEEEFYSLEKGVDDYVRNYLAKEQYY